MIGLLTGGRYTDTSVPRLAPLGAQQVLINGAQDLIIPPAYAEGYARPMRAAGDSVTVRMIDRTGHVELIAPESAAWNATVQEIEAAFRHPDEGRDLRRQGSATAARDSDLRRDDDK